MVNPMSRTPGRWHQDFYPTLEGEPSVLDRDILNEQGELIVTAYTTKQGGHAEGLANAEFIVLAVNSHDALTEALRQVHEWLDNIYDVDEESGTGHMTESPPGGGEIMRLITAALKLAEGGTP